MEVFMKYTILLGSLLMSLNAFALVCESQEVPAKKIKLVEVSNKLVQGESYIRTTGNLFVGKVVKDFLNGDTYKLFNQNGVAFSFTHKKELDFQINHCRARFCPPTTPLPTKPSIGKLSTDGLDDEYFDCF